MLNHVEIDEKGSKLMEDVFGIVKETIDDKDSVLVNELVHATEKLNKYPRELTRSEKDNVFATDHFYFPRDIQSNDHYSSLDHYDLLILSFICSQAKMRKKNVIHSQLITIESILSVVEWQSTRKKAVEKKIKESIDKLSRIEAIVIRRDDILNAISFEMFIDRYLKVNMYEYLMIVKKIENLSKRTTALALYLAINDTQYKIEEKEHTFITFSSMDVLGDKSTLSTRTITRAIADLEDVNAVAVYTVSLRRNSHKGTKKNVISCYSHRDKLRRYVETEITNREGKYVYLYDTRKESSIDPK